MMLMSAIKSSPHTTPRKKNNRTILNYPGFLEKQWRFGEESNDESDGGRAEDSDGEDDDMVDLYKRNQHPCRSLSSLQSFVYQQYLYNLPNSIMLKYHHNSMIPPCLATLHASSPSMRLGPLV